MLDAALEPPDPVALLEYLLEQSPQYGIQAKGDDEWAALFQPYITALAETPMACLVEAFGAWNRGEMYPKEPGRHGFYPKSAELVVLAKPVATRLGGFRFILKQAMRHVEKLPPPTVDPEEKRRQLEALGLLDANGKLRRDIPARETRPGGGQ